MSAMIQPRRYDMVPDLLRVDWAESFKCAGPGAGCLAAWAGGGTSMQLACTGINLDGDKFFAEWRVDLAPRPAEGRSCPCEASTRRR